MLFRAHLGVFVLSASALAAQQPPSERPQSESARFGTTAAGVVVDVVVRDRRGRPVTGLSAKDFEVFEDGVRQQVIAFEPYTAADAPESAEEAARLARVSAAGPGSRRQRLAEGPPLVAVAWDRLEPEGRALAHQAALRLVRTRAPGELVGVFLTDMTLQTIQPYTTDPRLLSAAVERLATTATSALTREPTSIDSLVGRAETSPTASAADSGYGLAGFPQARGERDASQRGERPDVISVTDVTTMLIRMERSYRQFLYETQGRASMLGLLALVESLGQLPGRKTVLYFCEGLTISESQQARFRAVIDTANRNNVSVYTFDAAGLRVHSAQKQTAREIRELTFTALGTEASRMVKWTEELEDNERLLRMDPAVSLAILARQTGGLLINNTNALDRGIDAINDDRRHHYLLSYVSTNSTLDGTYRQIAVSVSKPDVEVRARRGYRASPSGTSAPVLEYERPAMAALATAPTPAAFPITALALRTPMPDRRGLVSMLVAVGGRSLAVTRSGDGLQYSAGATVLARLMAADNREVARVSQQYRFTGDYEHRDDHRRGVLFFRTASLGPGSHTLEAVVHDLAGDRSSVKRVAVEGTAGDAGTVVGDLFVASRIEPAPERQAGGEPHPLEWRGQLYTPSVLDVFTRSNRHELTLVLPAVVPGETPATRLELRSGTRLVETIPVTSEAPDPDGRLLFVARVSLDRLSPGEYVAAVTVRDGTADPSVRTARFTLQP